ncbi:MAG: ATP-binding protein [Cytophagales bacterium]|nr:ATP-binding protein [Cytophagales bacterium]
MLSNSKSVALLIAAAVSIITTSFLSLVNGVPAGGLIVVFVLSFSSTYILTYFTVDVFIFGQIEKINNRITRMKAEDFSFVEEDNKAASGNPLTKINREILTYARTKQQEIDELRKAESFRREFIADISHELKTPIFAAQGFVHTLLDGAVKDKNVRNKFLKKAAKSLDGLDRIVQDLLTISQVETGVIKMELENFNINELIQEVYDQFEGKAEKKDIELKFDDFCPTDLYVFADRHKIFQVILNLVSNSIKYRKEEQTFVIASLVEHEREVEVILKDNGIGISEKHIARIFERFYRIDKSRSREKGGTGLGLSIVKHILEAHQSHIMVQSKQNQGSEFSFKLQKGRPYNWSREG